MIPADKGLGRILRRSAGMAAARLLQRRIEDQRMNAITPVVGGLVGQHDFGLRTAQPRRQPGVPAVLGRHVDAGHRVPRPVAAGRTGMNLNANPVVASEQAVS